MNLITILLMMFGMTLFDAPEAEATKTHEVSILQRVEPGLMPAYDQAKMVIRE